MKAVAAVLAALALSSLSAAATAACSSVFPTFDDVLASESPIVIGRVISTGHDEPTYTVAVERVVRGHADSTVVVTTWSTYCGDGLVGDGLPAGTRLMIALDVPSTASMNPAKALAPFWFYHRGQVHGAIEGTPLVSSLDELADRIAALPDTAADVPAHSSLMFYVSVAGLLALLAAGIFFLKPPSRLPR
jgi:hypothetical protein